ncbi:hypothetical protein [Arcanobacterium haemolyticum]
MSDFIMPTREHLEELDEEKFRELFDLVMDERYARTVRKSAPVELAELQRNVLRSRDRVQPVVEVGQKPRKEQEGDIPVWVKPKNSTQNYPQNYFVKHEGKFYQSMLDDNDTVPGSGEDSLWIEFPLADTPVKPKGVEWEPDRPLLEGDYVNYLDKTYRVKENHTSTREQTPDKTPEFYEEA